MKLPDWRTSSAGTRVRVALWLHSEVGEGGAFTKADLRDAFPGVEQVDRRMRDLRPEGWVITTYREDRSLEVHELRLVQEGGPVWEPGYKSNQGAGVGDKERRAIFAADNYMCVYCGIAAGEAYSDDPFRTAKLTLSRADSLESGQPGLLTACDRCHAAVRAEDGADELIADIDALDESQRERLQTWVRQGRRNLSTEHELWGRYRRLPRDSRRVVEGHLRG